MAVLVASVLGIVVGEPLFSYLDPVSAARIFTILGSCGIFSLIRYVLLFSALALGFVD